MNHSSLALFFPERMDAIDKTNLDLSGVKRVQLFLGAAVSLLEQLDYLASKGVRVTLRIEEPNNEPVAVAASYYHLATHQDILRRIDIVRSHVPVEAVITGNEPQQGYDLTWSSSNWGNNPDAVFSNPGGKAEAHKRAVLELGKAIAARGIKVVTPGWEHRRVTSRDPAQPGRASWREIVLPAYNGVEAGRQVYEPDNGAHLYAHNWASPEDDNRYLWAAGIEVERCHRAVWINETNVNGGTPLERMQAIVKMIALLNSVPWGSRIISLCPFVSNGLGNSYKPGYIMRDPECYRLLGTWAG